MGPGRPEDTEGPSETVQLPHGTDVVTRVAHEADRTDIPAGTVGRVVGSQQNDVDILIFGVGTVRYRRSEVAAFRSGQLRYALTREFAWNALRANVVVEAVVGSRAWGLADASSDTDLRGVFVLPFPWSSRIGSSPEDLVSADGSAVYWEVAKAVSNGLRADPNTLELLFLPGVRALDPIGAQGVLQAKSFEALALHATAEASLPDTARRLRPKNAYNLLRLLITATGWLRAGHPEFEMRGAVRDELFAIKRGEVELDVVVALSGAHAYGFRRPIATST